ncbi:MAG: GNAT family N-acetyltransferase [Flavobacteriaceae bacterium]|nr:GNAT family N-acetyltransferase [Flavobacteriaceae bacterium]
MPEIKFREFTAKDSEQFKALNIEWLKKYFEVEPIDERVLSNPRSEILDSGGFIFMSEIKDEVIGTFAFIKKGNQIFEFSKMAIDPKFRNKGYGNVMIQFAISFAKKYRWNKIILYSNRILKNSIHLYFKYGFIEVPMEADVIYYRGNIKMELELD